MSETLNLVWKPPGPVAARFMAATKMVQILNGPVGSGKTTANCIKHMRIAARQMQSSRDGHRKYKVCVVRDTYRQLWSTTLPSWWKRAPKSEGEFTGATNGPASHRIAFRLKDGTLVDFQADFVAIGENAVEDVLRGYEPTSFYLNEMDLLAREVYLYAKGRCGRYPDMSEGGPSWYGVTGDANAPELESWLYRDIFENVPSDVELFIQPSGLSPQAENCENLPAGYYTNQANGQPQWYVERMIKNRPGYSRAGKPIYAEFQDALHVAADPLRFEPDLLLLVGLDAGLHPAAAFAQRMPNGQWRILGELVGEAGMGAMRFGRLLAQRLRSDFEGARKVRGYADPSAAYGADRQAGESTWIEIVAQEAGIAVDPAPTNALIPRIEAVRRPLTLLIDGAPGFLLSPTCPTLRGGFNSGYRFKKITGADDRYSEEPDKNDFSHPHDALQYAMSAGGEDEEIRGRKAQLGRGDRTAHVHDWDPLRPG